MVLNGLAPGDAKPAHALRDFFESAYDAAATLAHWDRGLLEHRLS